MHSCPGTLQRTHIWESSCKAGTQFEALANKISSGEYGTVFEARCGNQYNYVVKWITNDNMDDNTLDEEIALQNISYGSARPIYEKWECIENGTVYKSGYITDRLDVTLYSDLYTLTTEQITQARIYYSIIFTDLLVIYDRLFPTIPLDKVLLTEMMHEINHYYSLRPMEKLYNSFVDVIADLGIHIDVSNDIETITYDDEHRNIIIPLLHLTDTMEQQKKKCFQFLMVMNCLDGIHNAGVYHNDAHEGNFMRKQNEDKYYAIDFGRAKRFRSDTNENPDIDSLIDSIRARLERKNVPVQHDLKYLVYMYPLIKPMVSFLYDKSYKDYLDQFNNIFDKEMKRHNKIDIANINELIQQTDAKLSLFGKKKKKYTKKSSRKKAQ
jgi:hypothetical protein